MENINRGMHGDSLPMLSPLGLSNRKPLPLGMGRNGYCLFVLVSVLLLKNLAIFVIYSLSPTIFHLYVKRTCFAAQNAPNMDSCVLPFRNNGSYNISCLKSEMLFLSRKIASRKPRRIDICAAMLSATSRFVVLDYRGL